MLPLGIAIEVADYELVDLLLDTGAAVDSRSFPSETPLMVAAGCDHVDTVRLLLDRGADPRRQDDAGRTAFDWALQSKSQRTAAVLRPQ